MTQYPAEVKAAVIAALLAGATAHSISKERGIPYTTIKSWNFELRQLLMDKAARHKRFQEIDVGEKLAGYLDASLDALRVQVEFTKDIEWLKKQDASSFAVLHGVMVDKIIRLLEAAEAAAELQRGSAADAEADKAGA